MSNAKHLEKELQWFSQVLDVRFKIYFDKDCPVDNIFALEPPGLNGQVSNYSRFLDDFGLNKAERLMLVLALIPHVRPEVLDIFFTQNAHYNRGFTEFGGLQGKKYSGFLPTGETAMFLLSGGDLKKRFQFHYLFDQDHFFAQKNIISLDQSTEEEPLFSGTLQLDSDYVDYFTTGKTTKPTFSTNFPAKRINTALTWDDLVLPPATMEQIEEVTAWLKHGQTLMEDWGLKKRILPGFRVLFHGPSGTGKTLTASLLGKMSEQDLYRVDLSLTVSKYIGETEKNLARIFDRAADKQWILFFDEADALFGKRTEISSAHDRYANQEISYLLQRMEDYPGMVILATNLKSNIDDAFTRRFQSVIYFPVPGKEERRELWQNAFPKKLSLHNSVDLEELADQYELTGASIMNVVRYCSLMALDDGNTKISGITQDAIRKGIKKEYQKEGRTL